MPTDRTDLDARIAAARKGDTVRGLIFNAVFDTLDEHLGAAAVAACDPKGTGHRTDFFAYPVEDFLRLAWDAADRLEPRLGSTDAAFRAMGYRAATNTFGSMVGATLIALAGRAGVKNLLSNAAGAYRATVSYGERSISWPGPRQARITFLRDFLVPPFHCGVFEASAEAMGARAVMAKGHQTGPLDAVYDVSWEE